VSALATTVLAPFALFIASAALVWIWVGAFADLIWISMLRPRLAVGVVLGLALAVLLVLYSVIPRGAVQPFALPMLAAVVIAPIAARALIDRAAREIFARRGGPFRLDPASLKLADVFILEDLRLRSVYRAPMSEPPAPQIQP
jgi:hypothetical protein